MLKHHVAAILGYHDGVPSVWHFILTSIMSTLPLEVANSIIDFTLAGEHVRERVLSPFVLVCRAWQKIVEQKIYEFMDLTWLYWSKASDEACERTADLICRTFTEKPQLAGRVKSLSIYLRYEGRVAAKYVGLIPYCRILSTLHLSGYAPRDPLFFVNTITKLDIRKMYLDLSPVGLYVFDDGEDIIRLLRHWPNIEEVCIEGSIIQESSPNVDTDILTRKSLENSVHTTLPMKELLLLKAGSMSPAGLKALHALSLPFLKHFSVNVSDDTGADEALLECLTNWAAQLETLRLSRDPDGLDEWPYKQRLGESLKRFNSLKTLRISARMLDPNDLLSILSLEELTYLRVEKDDLETLLTGLEKTILVNGERTPTHLPSLSSITLVASDSDQRERLEAICSVRQISLQFSTRVRRRFAFAAWNNWDD